MRTRWIIAAALVARSGSSGSARGSGSCAAPSFMVRRHPLGDRRAWRWSCWARSLGWSALRSRSPGLSQAVQVASSGPTVTSLPRRTSGSLSRLDVGQQALHDLRVVDPQVAEALVAVGPALDVEQGRARRAARRTAAARRRRSAACGGRRTDGDPPLPEEPQRGARRGRVALRAEHLDVRHLLRRGLAAAGLAIGRR